MKKLAMFLGAAMFCSVSYADHPAKQSRVETFVEGIPGIYDMQFDNGDMVVTSNDALIKVAITEGRDELSGEFPIQNLADVPDIALSSIRVGGDYYVLKNLDRTLVKVASNGEVSVVAENLGAPIDIAQHGDDFIVTDLGNPEDPTQNTRLLRVSLDGTVSVIASEGFEDFAGMAGIEVLGDTFWVTDFNLGVLYKIDLDGNVETMASDLGHPVGIEYDGKNFIIANFGDGMLGLANGNLWRVSSYGKVRKIARRSTPMGNPSDVALLGPDIYFSDIILGRISKVRCGLCKKR